MTDTSTDPHSAWQALLERLSAQRASLVDSFIELLEQQGYYASIDVGDEDLRNTADMTLEMLILQIAGAQVPTRLRGLPERLGRRRAQQGVEREKLLEAVRLDFRVIWGGLVRAQGSAPADLLVAHAEEVLAVVEAYIGDVQIAYLSELDALSRDSRAESRRALARLLNADGPNDEHIAALARALSVSADAEFAVFCVVGDDLQVPWRDDAVDWQVDEGLLLLRADDFDVVPGSFHGSVVRHIRGLAAVPDAAVRARRVAQLARDRVDGGLLTVADAELTIARGMLEQELPGIGNAVAAGLAELDDDDRARLVETVRVYSESGSIKATAERMYVHRNTVVNRLAQFRALTGFDLGVPADAARALLWLA